jgi:hypothetical protein
VQRSELCPEDCFVEARDVLELAKVLHETIGIRVDKLDKLVRDLHPVGQKQSLAFFLLPFMHGRGLHHEAIELKFFLISLVKFLVSSSNGF